MPDETQTQIAPDALSVPVVEPQSKPIIESVPEPQPIPQTESIPNTIETSVPIDPVGNSNQIEADKQKAILDNYKSKIGKTFTNGNQTAIVKEFLPQHWVGNRIVPAFLIYRDQKNVGFYVGAEEFLNNLKEKVN